jgi:hypothetical protein
MGKGPECTDKIDHCMRPNVWFACGKIVPGRLYRAVPVFEFEGSWYNYREKREEFSVLFKTKVVENLADEVRVGQPIVWLIEDNIEKKWVRSEWEALTSSRWECAIVESVAADSFKVKGWGYGIPADTARAIIETKQLSQ